MCVLAPSKWLSIDKNNINTRNTANNDTTGHAACRPGEVVHSMLVDMSAKSGHAWRMLICTDWAISSECTCNRSAVAFTVGSTNKRLIKLQKKLSNDYNVSKYLYCCRAKSHSSVDVVSDTAKQLQCFSYFAPGGIFSLKGKRNIDDSVWHSSGSPWKWKSLVYSQPRHASLRTINTPLLL